VERGAGASIRSEGEHRTNGTRFRVTRRHTADARESNVSVVATQVSRDTPNGHNARSKSNHTVALNTAAAPTKIYLMSTYY
jgi:nicotinamidase-related amidase